jgi:pimeloyl-ACP methyl ester carboxylesterase
MKPLLIFVHGLGTNAEDAWGSTPAAIRSDARLHGVDIQFWGFKTSSRPTNWLFDLLSKVRLETIRQLGEHLCSDIRQWSSARGGAGPIVLFGYSFGGLVAAAAAIEASKNRDLASWIRGIGLCATPIAGSDLLGKAGLLFKLAGSNVQLKDLRRDSQSRKELVAEFINRFVLSADGNPHRVSVFRASHDSVVQEHELWSGALNNTSVQSEVLAGGHNECVRDLMPRHENLEKIILWIMDRLGGPVELAPPKVSVPPIGDFEWLMLELSQEFGPIGAYTVWSKGTDPVRDVDERYLHRVGLQKLVYASIYMHDRARSSANLWACHQTGPEGPISLRSAEREGYFTFRQLVEKSTTGVHYRANPIVYDAPAINHKQVSVAAAAVAKKDVIFWPIETSQFDSSAERERGVTHVLGIPARDYDSPPLPIEGTPLCLTVDFTFTLEPGLQEVDLIIERGRRIRELLIKICEFNQ